MTMFSLQECDVAGDPVHHLPGHDGVYSGRPPPLCGAGLAVPRVLGLLVLLRGGHSTLLPHKGMFSLIKVRSPS